MSCVLSVMRLHAFCTRYPDEMSRFSYETLFAANILAVCFLLHNFVRGIAIFVYELSCSFGGNCDFLMR